MSEYPKHFAKGEQRRTALNKRQEVKLKFDGYRESDAPIKPTGDNEYQAPPRPGQPELPLTDAPTDEAAVESAETNGGTPAKTKK